MGKQLSTDKGDSNAQEHPFGGGGEPDPRNIVAEVTSATAEPPEIVGPDPESNVVVNQPIAEPLDYGYGTDQVADMNVDDTLGWVGDDQDRARVALEREQASDIPRKGVVEPLTKMTQPAD